MGLSFEAVLVGGVISALLAVLAGSFVHIMHCTFRINSLSVETPVQYTGEIQYTVYQRAPEKVSEPTLREILHQVIEKDSEVERLIRQIESNRQFYRATQKFVKDYRSTIKPYGMAQFIVMDTTRFFNNNIPISQTAINQLAYGDRQVLTPF